MKRITSPISKNPPSRGCFHPGASVLSRETLPVDGKPVTGVQMIQGMLQYIWPQDDKAIRDRVTLAVGLLISSKLMNVAVPFVFKYSIDYLNAANTINMDSAPATVATVGTSLLLGCKSPIMS